MIEMLKAVISQHADLNEDEWNEILPHFIPLIVPKNTKLVQLGKVATDMYFIRKGAIRSYYLHDVEELNNEFYFEGSFATSLTSFVNEAPSKLAVETIEESELLCLNKKAYDKLNNTIAKINAFTRHISERALQELYSNYHLLFADPEDRVHIVMSVQPELINRVPLQHLASFLQIPLVHLCQLIENMQNKN